MNENNFGVTVENNGYTHEQRIAIAQMQDKMIMNYLNGNVSAPVEDVKEMIAGLAEDLKPAIKFFNESKTDVPVKKRTSKKEQERLEFEAYEKRLELKALNAIKNGGY